VIVNNNHLMRIVLFAGLATAVTLAIIYRDQFDAVALEAWVRDAGPVAPLLFMLVYALAAVLFLPGSVMTLAGGALFGPVLGTFYNLTGATLGAILAFLVARYLASDWVAGKAGGRVKQLINGVESEGWRFVAFVRLLPYIIATYIFMLPGAIAFTYLGYAGREAVAGGEGLIQKGLLALALLAVVAFLPRLIGTLRRGPMLDIDQFRRWLDTENNLLVLDVRTSEDFVGEQGHIDKAVNIPVEELQQRMAELGDHLEHPVAIVCRTDKRSVKAALLLTEEGFADVHIVRGGMTKWNETGLPVVR
jgi:uncharacterized membrane protein YdjX (TVP38/TMEM64 family)/rhodanese-related sulfurtransferase